MGFRKVEGGGGRREGEGRNVRVEFIGDVKDGGDCERGLRKEEGCLKSRGYTESGY